MDKFSFDRIRRVNKVQNELMKENITVQPQLSFDGIALPGKMLKFISRLYVFHQSFMNTAIIINKDLETKILLTERFLIQQE